MAFFDCINPCRFGILQCLGQVVVVEERERERRIKLLLAAIAHAGLAGLAGWIM